MKFERGKETASSQLPGNNLKSDLSSYYFDKNQDMQKALASLNLIGQYANFDLLKQ